MKKVLIVASLIGLTSFSFAQSVSFGIKAGVNFPTLSVSDGSASATSSSSTGFHAGAIADIGLGQFSLQPGILFTTKGGSSGSSSFGSSDLKLNYLEIPVNLLYNISVPKAGKVFLGGGPYFAYGLSGNNGTKFGSGANDIKNPDFGINILGGFRFTNGLFLSGGYGFGLGNLNNDSSAGLTIKNKGASISLGYFFL
jgi:hypothetical protein